MSQSFKRGDRVAYTYQHWLNSKQFTIRQKYGTLIRYGKFRGWHNEMKALVHLDGNKKPYWYPVGKLSLVEDTEK